MHQVKLFKTLESEILATEREINAWLEESKAKVIHMTANIAPQTIGNESRTERKFLPSDVLITIVYEI